MSAPTAARIERLSADQKNSAARKENGIFFSSQIAHAIQFKGTVQLVAAKSRQALMSWRRRTKLALSCGFSRSSTHRAPWGVAPATPRTNLCVISSSCLQALASIDLWLWSVSSAEWWLEPLLGTRKRKPPGSPGNGDFFKSRYACKRGMH